MLGLPLKVECKPPLSYDGTPLVEPAAFVEAVTHHALCKEKKDQCQNDYEQQHSNPKPEWLSPFRGRRIRIGCHQNRLCAKSTACHGTAIYKSGPRFLLVRYRDWRHGSSQTLRTGICDSRMIP